jgi:hypothetical protein
MAVRTRPFVTGGELRAGYSGPGSGGHGELPAAVAVAKPQGQSRMPKPAVIYNWAQWGHIPARRGNAGRLWIDFTPAVERACLQRIASSYKLPEAIKTQAAQRLERNAV